MSTEYMKIKELLAELDKIEFEEPKKEEKRVTQGRDSIAKSHQAEGRNWVD